MKICEKKMNKRGLSVIIGYVILVSIGLALSTMVYSWLVFYIDTGEIVECPDGLSLSIRDVRCDSINRVLNFSVKNTGLFSVDGFTVKVNDKSSSSVGVFAIEDELTKVAPGYTMEFSYSYYDLVVKGPLKSDLTLLELQPMIKDEQGNYTFCQPMVREVLDCSLRGEVCSGGIDDDQDGLTDCDDIDDCRFDFRCSTEDPNLLLHYTFDDDRAHSYAGGLPDGILGDGTAETKPTYVSTGGYKGSGAYEFDGSADYINISDSSRLSPSSEITMSAWVNPSAIAGMRRDVFFTNDGYFLGIQDDGDVTSYIYNGGWREAEQNVGPYVGLDDWSFIAATYDGSNLITYVNGVPVRNVTVSGSISNPGNLVIGAKFDGSDEYFDGRIDEMRIYDRALTEDEINELFAFYTG